MSLPFAAFSASVAFTSACWVEPFAVWASWFTSSMRTSLRFVRSWVFSTSVVSVSTFVLTSPTSRATYFLVAQPEAATATTSAGRMIDFMQPPSLSLGRESPVPYGLRLRNVAAPRLDHDTLAGALDRDAAEDRRARRGIVAEPVLMLQLSDDAVGSFFQATEVTDGERPASRHLGVAREHGGA